MSEVVAFKSGKDLYEELCTGESETVICVGCTLVASDQTAYESGWQLDPPACPNCLRWVPVDDAACCAEGGGVPKHDSAGSAAGRRETENRANASMSRSEITIDRYRTKRFWAVYEAGALLCVTVYKKGALAVKERLDAAERVTPRA